MAFFKEELNKVKAFVFDVDGVLSTANILLTAEGDMLRNANTKDGYAIQYAIKKGYPVAIITGGRDKGVEKRYAYLGVKDIYMNSKDKVADLKDFMNKYNIDAENVMYMGDDLPDYLAMQQIGVPVCPADAVAQIKEISSYISDLNGGSGCVRDVIEQVLRVQNNWFIGDTDTQSV